eukprot:TRINITY_DN1579_c0_g6_i1.p1 TRINITY_DN1579_c0_g6~~TRINITY_DN1579_c0_g6_i1.p1  ORF type:complete len:276 (+),score=49.61 TRINITY_DN1579_c0_g6_i1:66-893(+)
MLRLWKPPNNSSALKRLPSEIRSLHRVPSMIHEQHRHLWWSAVNGDEESLRSLTSLHMINVQDRQGWTLLHWCAARGDAEACIFLTSNGAFVNLKDSSGKTPLCNACLKGHSECAAILIQHGASPELCVNMNATGDAALAQAVNIASSRPAVTSTRRVSRRSSSNSHRTSGKRELAVDDAPPAKRALAANADCFMDDDMQLQQQHQQHQQQQQQQYSFQQQQQFHQQVALQPQQYQLPLLHLPTCVATTASPVFIYHQQLAPNTARSRDDMDIAC